MQLGNSWIDDVSRVIATLIPKFSNIDLGTPQWPFRNVYVSGEIFGGDGLPLNNPLSVAAAGTAYSLTATAAALDFGTTDPVLVLDGPGTYLLIANAQLNYVGATFAASRTVTLKLRRTNNTAADISGAVSTLATAITTTVTATFAAVALPQVLYTTANSDDAITLFGDVSVVPSAGSLDAVAASITAIRVAN